MRTGSSMYCTHYYKINVATNAEPSLIGLLQSLNYELEAKGNIESSQIQHVRILCELLVTFNCLSYMDFLAVLIMVLPLLIVFSLFPCPREGGDWVARRFISSKTVQWWMTYVGSLPFRLCSLFSSTRGSTCLSGSCVKCTFDLYQYGGWQLTMWRDAALFLLSAVR